MADNAGGATAPVTASFTVSGPLAPNLSLSPITPTAFSMTGAGYSLSSSGSQYYNIYITTDGSSAITQWIVVIFGSANTARILTQNVPGATYDTVHTIDSSGQFGPLVASNFGDPGAWTSSNTCSAGRGWSGGQVNLNDYCIWPSSTPQWSKSFNDGSKLEVTCQYPSNVTGVLHLPAYMLWYTNPQGMRSRIAQCLFSGGINSATYRSGQQNACLVSSEWENIDGGSNDDNPLTATGFANNQFVFVTAQEPYLDVERYTYDGLANKLSWANEKYQYPNSTQTCDQGCAGQIGASLHPIGGLGWSVDPLVGLETESLFDQVFQQLQRMPGEPMRFIAGCDLNADGICDATDQGLLNNAVGKCVGQPGYVQRADVDGNGCVDPSDASIVQSSFGEYSAGCTRSLGYWMNHPNKWPLDLLNIGSQQYAPQQALQILNTPTNGNGALALAKQLIAAKLNIAAGASKAAAPMGVSDALILNLAPGRLPPFGNAFVVPQTTSPFGGILDRYNKGLLGPPACSQ